MKVDKLYFINIPKKLLVKKVITEKCQFSSEKLGIPSSDWGF